MSKTCISPSFEHPPGFPSGSPESPAGETRPKLDLSGLEPPAKLGESSIEEITIDGICGVY